MTLTAIVGPTASGKTDYALRWAAEHNAEIISVDSRQVYRDLQVGTAKPRGEWRTTTSGTRHYVVDGIVLHLVDILDPREIYSAADFAPQARAAVESILSRNRVPLLVGGTGLYFKALTDGLAALPPRDNGVREELRHLADQQGRAALHAELLKADPEAAAKIPANNIARVIRALEVYRLTGKPISAWHREHQEQPKTGLRLRYLGIDRSLEETDQRIAARCESMVSTGMIQETQALLDRGCSEQAPALTGLGYPRVIAFLKGLLTREELLRQLMIDTRRYAKRQRTWFRHQTAVEWIRI